VPPTDGGGDGAWVACIVDDVDARLWSNDDERQVLIEYHSPWSHLVSLLLSARRLCWPHLDASAATCLNVVMRQYVLNQRGQIADADEFDYSEIAHEFLEWLRSSPDYLAAVGKPWTRANTIIGRVGLSGLIRAAASG